MEIGGKGLANVDLIIPQGCSLTFEVVHKDEGGQPVDHTASDLHMAFQNKDGTGTIDLSSSCTGTATGVTVSITPAQSEALSLGKMLWDLIAEMTTGETVRLTYGNVSIVDTYALDDA